MAFVINEAGFGEAKAHVRVIDFQKRGPTRAHCTIFLAPHSKSALL